MAQGCVGITLPDTIAICAGAPVSMTAVLSNTAAYPVADITWSPATGLSDIHSLSPVVTTATPMYYVLTVQAQQGFNAITNGDFSSGNAGFTSEYVYNQTPGYVLNEGEYAVVTNPNSVHIDFATFGDHTTGAGNMMVFNGYLVPNVNIYCQTVNVQPNTLYDFSTWGPPVCR